MSARDELAGIAMLNGIRAVRDASAYTSGATHADMQEAAEDIADAILAAGWVPPERLALVRDSVRDVSREREAVIARVEALCDELAAFCCLDGPVPSGVDVPDDYESGLHHAARDLRAALRGDA